MLFSDANLFPQAATMIHDGKELSDRKKSELKAIYLEALIRFLDIYANDEIGGDVEIDITKVALLVNAPNFENDDMYSFSTIDDIFVLLEKLAITGLPIWRFLRIGDYQLNMLERSYDKLREDMMIEISKQNSCYGCVWLENLDTAFGRLTRCRKPSCVDRFRHSRDALDGVDMTKGCKWLTTLTKTPKAIESNNYTDFTRKYFMQDVERAREHFKENMQKDTFRIPKTLDERDSISLGVVYDAWEDFGAAFNNRRTKTERQDELRKAMLIEGMIRFFEIYAKMEMGNNFVANIKEISMFVDEMKVEDRDEFRSIQNYEDVYAILEEMILNGYDVSQFVIINPYL